MSNVARLPAPTREDWRQYLTYKATRDGPRLLQTLSNAVFILANDPSHGHDLHEVSGGMGTIYDDGKVMGPEVLPRLQSWLVAAWNVEIGHQTLEAAIGYVAEQRMRHPVRDYLKALKWDGVKRLPTWLSTYAGVEHSPYTARVGCWWMQQAAARGLEPGVKADYTLILEGAQGLGKSQALRALCPREEWFTDNISGFRDKDDRLQMAGHWIAELSELTALGKSTQEQIKSVIVQRVDVVRPPYGRATKRFPRMCVFAGTTNEKSHLSDSTGARRFWSVTVAKTPDIQGLERDRDQLWAEAVARERAGQERWPTGDVASMFAAEAESRRVELPWEGRIETWLEGRGNEVQTRELLDTCLQIPVDRQDTRVHKAIAQVMSALGWVPFRTRSARGYRRTT